MLRLLLVVALPPARSPSWDRAFAGMKTKAQELEVLQRAIDELGSDSYLGVWLASVVDEVTRDIRSDFYPTTLPSAARREADLISAATAQLCREHKARIKKECDDMTSQAIRHTQSIRDRAANAINQCWRELTA